MDLNQTKIWFHEALRLNFKMDGELRRMLLEDRHPRVNRFLEDLDKKMKEAMDVFFTRKKRYPSQETMKGLVYDLTAVFVRNLEVQAERLHESDIKRAAREAAIQNKKDMDDTLNGKASGIFEEAGVIIDDETRQDQTLGTEE